MKKLLIITWCSICCYSCAVPASDTPGMKQITMVLDVTDQNQLPNINTVLKLYHFDRDKLVAARFQICQVSDKQLNPEKEVFLPNNTVTEQDNRLEDPYFRDKLIVQFYENVRIATNEYIKANGEKGSLANSECFRTIASQLTDMVARNGKDNTLIVCSDLFDHSDVFNCYTVASQNKLLQHPKQVTASFEKMHLLPGTLPRTKVFFIYAPKDRKEDKLYMKMVEVYRSLLEKRGVQVFTGASEEVINREYN